MNEFSFIEYCKDLHKKRWFKKHCIWIEYPFSHYTFIKEHYLYKKDNELHKGILHCIWDDTKNTFEAIILDVLTYEKIHTIIPERQCKDFVKYYLLIHVCFNYENL